MQPAKPPAVAAVAITPELAQILAKLPRVRSKWPAEARLVRATEFNLMDGDKAVGVMRLDAGTRLKVVEIRKEHAVVRVGATESPVPVANTDIIERMGGREKILALPDDVPAKPAEAGKK